MPSFVGRYLWICLGGSFRGEASPRCLGNTKERIEVPVINERQKQTYFGALNYDTQEFLVQPYNKGDSSNAIAFVKYLVAQFPQSRIALIWDGASKQAFSRISSLLRVRKSRTD